MILLSLEVRALNRGNGNPGPALATATQHLRGWTVVRADGRRTEHVTIEEMVLDALQVADDGAVVVQTVPIDPGWISGSAIGRAPAPAPAAADPGPGAPQRRPVVTGPAGALVHRIGPLRFEWWPGLDIDVIRDGTTDPFTTIPAPKGPYREAVLADRATRWLRASGW